jgi:hypothetical protein
MISYALAPREMKEVLTQMCPDDRDGTTKMIPSLNMTPVVDAIMELIDRE